MYLGLFATVGMSVQDSRYAALAAPMGDWLDALRARGGAGAGLADRAAEALGAVKRHPAGSAEREEALQERFQTSHAEMESLSDELSGWMAGCFAKLGWRESLDPDNRGVLMEGPSGVVALLNINAPFPEGEDGRRACERAARGLEALAREWGLSRWASRSGAYMEGGAAVEENEEIDWALAREWGALEERRQIEAELGPAGDGERGSERSKGKGAL